MSIGCTTILAAATMAIALLLLSIHPATTDWFFYLARQAMGI